MRYLLASKFFVLFASFTLLLSIPTHSAQAGSWGETWASIQWKQYMEQILYQINGMMNGILKNVAIQIINQQVMIQVGGGSGQGPLFITNWQQFLYNQPQQIAQNYILNDFFQATTRGRGSFSNYQGALVTKAETPQEALAQTNSDQKAWLSQEGVVAGLTTFGSSGNTSNFNGYQKEVAKRTIFAKTPTIDIYDCTSNPSGIFEEGNWRCFNSFFQNPANNPLGYSMLAEEAYFSKLYQEQKKAEVIGQSYDGYLGKIDQNGNVILPGSTVKDTVSNTKDLGNKVIAGASNPYELMSSAITSAVTQAINEMFTRGIGEVQQSFRNNGFNMAGSQANTNWGAPSNMSLPSSSFNPGDWKKGISL
jgi:hypothetical protein